MSETKLTLGREEEADLMLRTTRFSPGVPRSFAALFLLGLGIVPIIESLAPKPPPEAKRAGILTAAPTATAAPRSHGLLPSAADIKQYEHNLQQQSPVFSGLRPRAQAVLSGTLGGGNEQVVWGHDGWLFYKQGVDYLTAEPFLDPSNMQLRRASGCMAPNPLPALLRFNHQLRARGIHLVLLPVPVKAAIYPDKLWSGYEPTAHPLQNPSFAEFKWTLQADDVLVYDPTETLMLARRLTNKLQYFPLDSHWTPAAAQITAQGLAGLIKLFGKLPWREPEQYTYRHIETADPGDLLRLLGLPADQKLLTRTVQPVDEVWTSSGGFCRSDPNADVLVMGDSYCGVYDGAGASLAQHLSADLQRPVDLLSLPNGGSFAARTELRRELLQGRDRLAGKRLVVHEFTMRDLTSGDWHMLDLPPEQKPRGAVSRDIALTSSPPAIR